MSKQISQLILPVVLVLLLFYYFKRQPGADVETLNSALKDSVFLVDVRTPEEFEYGTLKGAVNYPLDELERHAQYLGTYPRVIVFCQSGARSAKALQLLEQQGLRNVTNGGGIDELRELINKSK